ncbi:hypothetical protein [Clostridium aminobutyricum]|uniref:Uncharacterized protein n=1 Tax=Clostridium aminobutyricum TaxID=33953 RepID=A0A939D816_CLOAM|nr:hypothetical protein [Clostridium aminobutyricum]MBN7772846.1 hypothetical protein [Clostridium aminobutyricum]
MDLKITCNIDLAEGKENTYKEETMYLHDISEESTFFEILKESKLKCDIIGLEKYYPNSCDFMDNCPNVLPYLMVDGKYAWNVHTLDAKLKDFCATHSMVKEKGLFLTNKQVFGLDSNPDFLEYIVELWGNYGDNISAALLLTGEIISKKELVKRISKMFKENNLPAPCAVEEIILSREKWNHYELAEKLDIRPDSAKMLLRGFGYKWLNNEKLYSRLEDVTVT